MEDLKCYQDLFYYIKAQNIDFDDYKTLSTKLICMLKFPCSDEEIKELKECSRRFCIKLAKKWKKAFRNEGRFLLQNRSWLSLKFTWPTFCNYSNSEVKRGQRKCFQNLSNRQKRRRTEKLRQENLDELNFAISSKQRAGKLQLPYLILKY